MTVAHAIDWNIGTVGIKTKSITGLSRRDQSNALW